MATALQEIQKEVPPALREAVEARCAKAKAAARELALAPRARKDAVLHSAAERLLAREGEILAANGEDMAAAQAAGTGAALLDRLRLDRDRLAGIAAGLREIASLPDPVGEVIDGSRLPNGLELKRVRVPLGVVAVVYEARPNVTVDAAALALKAGNAVALRGSKLARRSNEALAKVMEESLAAGGLPAATITLLAGEDRTEIVALARAKRYVDLVIPRGGEQLKELLQEVATVPVIYAASGNCHIFVDRSASLEMAKEIVLNAKLQRPGVCNAVETVLVHREVAGRFVPVLVEALQKGGVEVRADRTARELAQGAGLAVAEAGAEDWATEYLDLKLALGVVEGLDAAIDHINRYGSGHSEAIVTEDLSAAQTFQWAVDAACVYVNASTRFTDGGQFGMGAEIGNSTQKLHARGPLGLRELTTYRYLVNGSGQVRP